jgi:Pentatricopeptide repeat domain
VLYLFHLFLCHRSTAAWAKSGVAEAPQNAERLLKRMLEHEYIHPDGISYNSVVDAWAYSGRPESLQKVRQIWQHMEQLYADGTKNQNEDDNQDQKIIIKPTIRTVNSIIHAHSKRVQEFAEARDFDSARKTAREAEEFLELMKERYEQTQDPDHMPDVTTYTSVMDTYGRCGRYASTIKAKELLEELQDLYEETGNPRLKPNVRTYTSLITAWSKTKSNESPMAAQALLDEMCNSKDPDLQPNMRTFTSVIQAWGRSPDHTKAQRALKLLQLLKQQHNEATNPNLKAELKPSLITYNAALEACCRCQGDLEQQMGALKIAFAILKAINQRDSGLTASHVTYATVLRACCFLLQPGEQRNKVATAVFEQAKKAGMVDFKVLFQLRKSVEAGVLAELLQGLPQDRQGIFDFNSAPPTWSRNVR